MNEQRIKDGVRFEINRFRENPVAFPLLVFRLEVALRLLGEIDFPEIEELQGVWGDLEIINAINENEKYNRATRKEIMKLLQEFESLVS